VESSRSFRQPAVLSVSSPRGASIEIGPVKILRIAPNELATSWHDALARADWTKSQVLKDDPGAGSWVRRATMLQREVVVKCRALNSPSRRIKHALRMGHAHKHWRGASRLLRAGIATGRPLAIGRASAEGTPCELLVLEFVAGRTLLHVLDDVARGVGPPVREQHAIARSVGLGIPQMLKAHLRNRDHKPSNLIVVRSRDGSFRIAPIDCVGIGGYGRDRLDFGEGEEMLASLMIEPTGCGCPPRRALWMRALRAWLDLSVLNRTQRHAALRTLLEEVNLAIRDHGDPRPRIDPLQRR
jgi:tRNA A-37 threonylcarbamoyl transferase component Bud32